MEYQTGIVGMIQHGDALVGAARRAIDAMQAAGGTVGYLRIALSEEEAKAVPDRNKGFSAIRSSGRDFGDDSRATQIDERIAPEAGDIVVRKQRVGSFFNHRPGSAVA